MKRTSPKLTFFTLHTQTDDSVTHSTIRGDSGALTLTQSVHAPSSESHMSSYLSRREGQDNDELVSPEAGEVNLRQVLTQKNAQMVINSSKKLYPTTAASTKQGFCSDISPPSSSAVSNNGWEIIRKRALTSLSQSTLLLFNGSKLCHDSLESKEFCISLSLS